MRNHSRDTGYSLRKRSVPCSTLAAASMPRSVGKWRRLGFGPRAPRWWGTESTRPRPASFASLRRRVVAGILPNADSSSAVAKGAAHSSRRVPSRVSARGWGLAAARRRIRRLADMAQAAASMAPGSSPTALITALGSDFPRRPRSRQRHRVWRETPKCRAALALPCHRT